MAYVEGQLGVIHCRGYSRGYLELCWSHVGRCSPNSGERYGKDNGN